MMAARKPARNDFDYYEQGKIQGVVLARISDLEIKIDKLRDEFTKSHEEMHRELHNVDAKIISLKGRVLGIAGGISAIITILGFIVVLVKELV